MKRSQSGFIPAGRTEFMIGVAVVGICAAVAISAWQDYRGRSSVAEGLAFASIARVAVAKAFAAGGPADMSRPGHVKWTPPAATENIRSVTIGKNGWINILYTDKIGGEGQRQLQIVPVAGGKALDLSDSASKGAKFEWECGGPAGKATVPVKYRPEKCR